MNGIFKRLLNVKGMVVESSRIVDGPLRPEPVLEVHVRAGKAAPRCSRCGRKRRGYGRGGGVRRWRHRDFGCWRVGPVAMMPRVDCPGCGVVVASVPWAEPGSSRNSCAVCSDARSDGSGGGELKHWVSRASRSRIPEIVEPAGKIRRRRPDVLRTIGPGYPNARLEAFDNGNKVTVRVAYGFHHVTNLIGLVMLRCGGLDIRLPQPAI